MLTVTHGKVIHQKREKVFGTGPVRPLDRNAKHRIMACARALSHPTEKGKHYGVITDKFLSVLGALLWGFHNCNDGRCFPAYEAIADRAHCSRTTVYEAINALEAAGILTWVNRIIRVRERVTDMFGVVLGHCRVLRTSNAYTFIDQKTTAKPAVLSKFEIPTGTANPVLRKTAEQDGSCDFRAKLDAIKGREAGQGTLFSNFDAAMGYARQLTRRRA